MESIRKVKVLINPKAGLLNTFNEVQSLLEKYWDIPGIDLSFQFSKTAEDGKEKTRRALAEGVDTILVVGGDGMVNSIGSCLIGSEVALGVVPKGSGNGFARHFGIPLDAKRAIPALKDSQRQVIDVGTANGRPFFVTCSLAWDAALVRSFEKSPVRGILPYVLAGAYEFMEYQPQRFNVDIDRKHSEAFADPMVFTVANLTQFGGGAKIAPKACHDDGYLELTVMLRHDMPLVLAQLPRLFSGTMDQVPSVISRKFQRLDVKRERPAPIQVDGELVEASSDVIIGVMPKALTVLVPKDITN